MIYLVRHGETNLNRQKKFYGRMDVSLNQKGINQAETLKQQLAAISFERIYVSGLKRTKETAKLLISQKHQPLVECLGFNEKGFGLWEGLDADEIQAAYPQEWANWLAEPFAVVPPQAEPFDEFEQRVVAAFKAVLRQKRESLEAGNQQPILIVGHLGVLRVIHQFLKPESLFWEFDVPQGEYFVIPQELIWGK